jgi:hypothetical protein
MVSAEYPGIHIEMIVPNSSVPNNQLQPLTGHPSDMETASAWETLWRILLQPRIDSCDTQGISTPPIEVPADNQVEDDG